MINIGTAGLILVILFYFIFLFIYRLSYVLLIVSVVKVFQKNGKEKLEQWQTAQKEKTKTE